MKNMNIALASYSFHGLIDVGSMNIFGYLETIYSRFHVQYADIWTGLLPPSAIDEAHLFRVRSFMDEHDMKLANLCVDGPSVWEDDAHQREANRLLMLDYIRAAAILGAQTIRIDFGGKNGEMTEEAFLYIVARYKEYCALCQVHGMKIGPENHWGWDRNPDYLIRVRDAVNHPAYGHLLHIGNWTEGEQEKMLEACLPNLMHMHISAESLPFAKDILRRIALTDYTGAYSVEHHSGEHELIRVQWQLGAVKGLLAELQSEGFENTAQKSFFEKIYEE